MGYFKTWIEGVPIPYFGPLTSAFASVADRLRDLSLRAIRIHLPSDAIGDADAMALLGSERQLERAPSETDTAYAERLIHWIQIYQQASTPLGLLLLLDEMGLGDGVIIQQNGLAWHLNATPNLADLADAGGLPSWCTRTVLPNGNPAIPASTDGKAAIAALTIPWASIGAGPMDADGNQWCGRFIVAWPSGLPGGLTFADPDTLALARRTVKAWRPAAKWCAGFYVSDSGEAWDAPTTRTWDDGGAAWWDEGTTSFYSAE